MISENGRWGANQWGGYEGARWGGIDTDVYSITKDNYFSRTQPAKYEQLANVVEVTTQPWALQPESDLWSSSEDITVQPAESITIDVVFSDVPVLSSTCTTVITAVSGDAIVLDDNFFYADSAVITIKNTNANVGVCSVKVTGQYFKVDGAETIISEDSDSITTNGKMLYQYKKNHLIQTTEVAQLIADKLLASYKTYRKDTMIDWRGDPSIELADIIEVPEYQKNDIDVRANFRVYKNKISFDGTLRGETEGRKIE